MRPHDEMQRVRRLLEAGCTPAQASRETGVPASTIVRWHKGRTAAFGAPAGAGPWRPPEPLSYAYLLGVYLGDGHVTVRPADVAVCGCSSIAPIRRSSWRRGPL